MGIEDGGLIWDEMNMNTAMIDFQKLYPDYTFDGKAILSLILQGRLLMRLSNY